jgi:cytochrome c-type biogenesis protein CcmH/NrfF
VKSWLTRVWALAVGVVLFIGMIGCAAGTDDDEKARRVREISESINSPFCPASTLASCGSPNAAKWRTEIRQWVDEGLTKNEICARLEQRARHKLCVGPRGPWMWSLPFIIAAASIGLLALVLRRFVRPTDDATAPAAEPEAANAASDLDEKLDQELDELDDD